MKNIVLVAHNIRSTHNVGSLLRTCDGLGVSKVFLTGYTPYPLKENDSRLPHISQKLTDQIHKTALGAELTTDWDYIESIEETIATLKIMGYRIIALEQSSASKDLSKHKSPENIAIIIGEEVYGIPPEILKKCDEIVEISMLGEKESFNVSVAAGIALYHFRFFS